MKARIPGVRNSAHVPVAQALQRKDRRATQSGQAAVQREGPWPKVKPDDAALKQLLHAHISDKRGSCQLCAAGVFQVLSAVVDGSKGENLGAQLITWAENAGTREADAHNHTAVTATWEGVKYVIDTTAGQFGGADLYVGSVAGWRAHILALANKKDSKVSAPRYDEQATPFSPAAMQQIRQAHQKRFPRASVHMLSSAPAGGPNPAK